MSESKLASPVMLTVTFVLAALAVQTILLNAMPNIGMGGLGLFYVVWPLLAVWTIALYFILRRMESARALFAVTCITVMVIACVWVYPQDTPVSFWQKLGTVRDWAMSALR